VRIRLNYAEACILPPSAYGGGFADPSMHRIVEVSRRIMDPVEVTA
jgi:hypothetical protein